MQKLSTAMVFARVLSIAVTLLLLVCNRGQRSVDDNSEGVDVVSMLCVVLGM